MNRQKLSIQRRPLALVLGISIPSFLVIFALAASLLLLNPHATAGRAGGLSLNADLPGVSTDIPVGYHQSPNTMSGGCWSYGTWSHDATSVSNGTPQMYGIEGSDAPSLGLAYDRCDNIIQVTISPSGYDYYKVDWWRPGRSGWTQFTTGNSIVNFTNAHYGTYYEFTVDTCTSHWYGDSCNAWSARVYINTNV